MAERYTFTEELAHTVTHGLGAVGSAGGWVLLLMLAIKRGAFHVVSCSIYAFTLVLMYLASALYHAVPADRSQLKQRLRVLDHSAIFLLIAGTYTPFALLSLRGSLGLSVLVLIWVLAVAGVLVRSLFSDRFRSGPVLFYLPMSWLVVAVLGPLQRALPETVTWLLVSGGIAYTAGVGFYVWRGLRYHHAIWHCFVLLGSALHFVAVRLCLVFAS